MNKQIDFAKFLSTLTAVAEYYTKELSEGVQMLYWQGLEQYDLQAVEKAFWDHANNPDNGQFMPKIGDVRRAIEGRTQDQAAIAWSKVDQAVRVVGLYQDVVFDDPIIHRVISDMGGWIWLGSQKEDEWPFVSKNFENRYRGYRTRGGAPEYQRILIGLANAHNEKEGFESHPPVLIGNQEKAKAVMLGGSSKPLIEMRQASASIPALSLVKIDA